MIVLNRLRATRFKQLDEIDLRFPEKGTVLIEGHNEAGKSSLFEAVAFALYGRPLINDRDYKIDHLKQYGADEMEVILDFSIDKRAFSVIRKFGKRHVAKLILPAGDDGESETISVLSEIEKRLSEELRLSFDALLNTCFVEQKRLERLEDLNPNARQETINELLNLKVLTRLQSEFKVGGEDRSTLELQKSRVAIAALDDEWPRLIASAEAARRCWLWTQWRDADRRGGDLQTEIAAAQKSAQLADHRREKIENQLRQADDLHRGLSTLHGELTLGARAWDEAQSGLQQAKNRALELQKLRDELPAREAQQQEYSQLAERLALLENSERENVSLQEKSAAKLAALKAHDEAQTAFEENRKTLDERERERQAARAELAKNENAQAERQAAHHRENRLKVWLVQLEKRQSLAQREHEIAAQLQAAQNDAAQLENSQARLRHLQIARELAAQLRQNEAGIIEAQRELENAQRELQRETERAKRRAELETERASAQARLRENEELYAQAQREMREVQLRAALEKWLAAHAAAQDENENAAPLEELAAREAQAQSALQSAQRNAAKSRRARVPGLAALGAGAVAVAVAALSGFSSGVGIGAAVLALVLWAVGAWILSGAARADKDATAEYSRLRSETDSLAGERRALEMQAQLAAQNAQRELQHRQETQRALQVLGAEIPASIAAARQELAALLQHSPDAARELLAARESALHEARLQNGIAAKALENHGGQSEEKSWREAVARGVETLEKTQTARNETQQQIKNLFGAVDDSALRVALQNGDDRDLQNLLDSARGELSAAQNAANQIPSLESALQKAKESGEIVWRECLEIAQALGFSADKNEEASEFAAHAGREIAALQAARQSVPDEILAQNVAQARSTLGALENANSVLEAQQKQRREFLQSLSRAQLLADLESVHKAQAENEAALETLGDVREALRERELPVTGPALQAALAARRQSLQHAREEAAQLAATQENVAEKRTKVAAAQTQFEEIWQRVFPGAKAPDSCAMADKALPIRAAQLQDELSALNEAELQTQLAQLQSESSELRNLLATLQHRLESAQEESASLARLLQVENLQSAEEFLSEFEARAELENAPRRSAAEWEQEAQTRREAVAHNRSTRRARAEAAGQSEEVLQLAQEQQTLREIEERIAVKRRAGEIVETTRASIVKRVMPLTMQNIRQLLPLLTENRYQDVEWDEEKNWILIYDSQARELVRKRTFSGGARDQISLALRLAFALATLPSEHNTRPGFLFLDEPLSSFDRARTQALVDLLTRGLIRQRFEQIFLVSHSESFDPALFDFRLRMENGRVALSTLPT